MISWRISTADLYPEKSSPAPVSLFPILVYFNFSLVLLFIPSRPMKRAEDQELQPLRFSGFKTSQQGDF